MPSQNLRADVAGGDLLVRVLLEHMRVLQNRRGTNRRCSNPAGLPVKKECLDGTGGSPCLLLPLDVLECIHPFALHVASRGGGELAVPEKKVFMLLRIGWD